MYQQQTPQPRDERNRSSSEGEYEGGYAGNLQQSDQLADAIARRLQAQSPSQIPMQPLGRFPSSPTTVTAGMRLALAIVSVVMLIPLSAIILSAIGSFFGLIGLILIAAAILGINLLFSFR